MMKIMGKKFLLRLAVCLIFAQRIFSIEMGIRVSPAMTISLGDDSETIKGFAYGARLNYDFDLLGFLTVGPELSFTYIPKVGKPSYMLDFAPGISVGGYYNFLSRFIVGGDVAGGIHFTTYDYPGKLNAAGTGYEIGKEPGTILASNLYARVSGDVLFRVSPEFSIGIGGGYAYYPLDKSTALLSGIQAGLVAKFTFDTVKSTGNVFGDLNQQFGIFPLYANVYKTNEIASIRITNGESSEIRKVNVFFRAGRYTSSLYPCGSAKRIRRNETVEIPLCADFSPEIFSFTENGQIPGEVVIEYELLGKKKTAVETVVVSVNNRNSFQWADASALALFVSPNSETVLELSKQIVGNARDNLRTGLNRNMQFAMYVVESVNTMGIARVADPSSPYAEYHLDPEKIDFIQYPFQTLTYSSGDSDDIGILVASLLVSAGIDAAFIPLNDDFAVCVSLGNASSSKNFVNNPDDSLVVVDDEAWLPLSMNSLRKGFNASWKSAVEKINAQLAAEEDVEIVVLSDAWEYYPPMGFGGNANYTRPSDAEIKRRATNELNAYISAELSPIIRRAQNEVNRNPTDVSYNALGMAYVRAGDYNSARATFRRAADTGSIKAMINLANVALIQNDFGEAEKWYNEVLKKEPEHSGALKGLENIKAKTGKK